MNGATSTLPSPGSNLLGRWLSALSERGRALLSRSGADAAVRRGDLVQLAEQLLSRRGEASAVAHARALLTALATAGPEARLDFFRALAERFGPDRFAVERAVQALPTVPEAVEALHAASEPRRQALFRRLNFAPGGTQALVGLRAELLALLPQHPELKPVDADFVHLFSSWFNRGFLVLSRIDWHTPAAVLEKLIRYEAVHAIQGWDDLRHRVDPPDRRCYGFFHPQLPDEPLIFVEVALARELPSAVAPLLDRSRPPLPADEATTAVFYSISNTQRGLEGISFGNFLIKQVVEDLQRELPGLKQFVTLSPVPGFAAWLTQARKAGGSLEAGLRRALAPLDEAGWAEDEARAESLRPALFAAAAAYFLTARTATGRPLDPVARFHLGNGARLERFHFLADRSPRGLRQSHGLMVNYLYALRDIEAQHEAYAEQGAVAAAPAVRRLLRGPKSSPAHEPV
ncbi:MAG: malonyl-CoA decarboxylase [Verrucomicrobia bacterium]|nr:malonyl-CoA decarboxylase [Verrucomicrobiota bacterium]